MKVLYSKYLPPKGFAAINLFGFIIGRKEYGSLSKYDLNHERIHTRQMIELVWVLFYLFYVLEWFFRIIQYRNLKDAYYNISFEREAYNNGHKLNYLRERRWYASFKYLKKQV